MLRNDFNRGVVAALFSLFLPTLVYGEGSLSVKGYLDRTSVRPGESVQITIIVANAGPATATDCTVQTLPRSLTCKPAPFLLRPKEERTVDCELTINDEGPVNVVAIVSWKEDGITTRVSSQLLGQMSVSTPSWFKREEISVIGVAVLIILGFVLWWYRRLLFGPHAFFVYIVAGLIVTAVILIVAGLLSAGGSLVLYGSVLLVISTLLAILGEKGTRRLLTRVQKAGPVEFSVAAEKIQYYQVIEARERDVKKPSFSVDLVVQYGRTLNNYINLYRLEAYSLESKLIDNNPTAPTPQVSGLQWIESLPAEKTAALGDKLEELKQLYRVIDGYERFKKLFDDDIHRLLMEAKSDKTKRDRNVRDAVRIIKQFNSNITDPKSIPPHSSATVAHLHLVLGENEVAFATLYQAQSDFPDAIVSNFWLAFFLMDVANDSYTALGYADKALEAAVQFQGAIHNWHRGWSDRTKGVDNALAKHLKAELETYDLQIMKKLEDWLGRLRHQLENFVAYGIALSELMHREDNARNYSKAAVDADPENMDYIDTLGLVKLTFGIAHRKREDVKDALKHFNRVAYHYARSGSRYERKLSRLHLKRAKSALRSITDWDD